MEYQLAEIASDIEGHFYYHTKMVTITELLLFPVPIKMRLMVF